jgi:hypothetical protein
MSIGKVKKSFVANMVDERDVATVEKEIEKLQEKMVILQQELQTLLEEVPLLPP